MRAREQEGRPVLQNQITSPTKNTRTVTLEWSMTKERGECTPTAQGKIHKAKKNTHNPPPTSILSLPLWSAQKELG